MERFVYSLGTLPTMLTMIRNNNYNFVKILLFVDLER